MRENRKWFCIVWKQNVVITNCLGTVARPEWNNTIIKFKCEFLFSHFSSHRTCYIFKIHRRAETIEWVIENVKYTYYMLILLSREHYSWLLKHLSSLELHSEKYLFKCESPISPLLFYGLILWLLRVILFMLVQVVWNTIRDFNSFSHQFRIQHNNNDK